MLLPRPRPLSYLRRDARTSRRYASRADLYHSKVRAYPFAFPLAEAMLKMSEAQAAKIPFIKRVFSSTMARWFPGFGFEPIEPIKPTIMKALYLPMWMIDAEIEANVWVTGLGDPVQRKVTAQMENSYMPGFVNEPLSRISFNDPLLFDLKPVPWSHFLETKYNLNPDCIPFTLSPLCLPEMIRRVSYRDCTINKTPINKTLRFDPTSVKVNLLAAYPILLPVYIGKYDYSLFQDSFSATFILEAYHHHGRIIFENTNVPPWESIDSSDMPWPEWLSPREDKKEFLLSRGDDAPFSRINLALELNTPELVNAINAWINEKAGRRQAFETFSKFENATKVDMDDSRVREYTDKETLANHRWMALTLELWLLKGMLDKMKQADGTYAAKVYRVGTVVEAIERSSPSKAEKLGPAVLDQPAGDEFTKMLLTAEAELKKKQVETKPQWLKEWESVHQKKDRR